MPIVVNSPHSGRPVKVREQDIGRAVQDETGKVFYVVPRSDGSGYYGCPTRSGSPRWELKASQMEGRQQDALDVGQARNQQQVHNAAGRRNLRGKLVILFLAAVMGTLVYLFTLGPFKDLEWRQPPVGPPPPSLPSEPTPANPPGP